MQARTACHGLAEDRGAPMYCSNIIMYVGPNCIKSNVDNGKDKLLEVMMKWFHAGIVALVLYTWSTERRPTIIIPLAFVFNGENVLCDVRSPVCSEREHSSLF